MKKTVSIKLTLDLATAAWLEDLAHIYHCSKGRALARHVRELDREALVQESRRKSKVSRN